MFMPAISQCFDYGWKCHLTTIAFSYRFAQITEVNCNSGYFLVNDNPIRTFFKCVKKIIVLAEQKFVIAEETNEPTYKKSFLLREVSRFETICLDDDF